MSSSLEVESETRGITKQQVRDFVPKRIKELRFGVLSARDIVKQSVVEVSDRNVYDLTMAAGERQTTQNGPLDKRMGVSLRNTRCDTCGRPDKECNGHFGHVKLALPAFHIGFMKKIVEILQCICKDCSRVLLTDKECRIFLDRLRRPGIDNVEKKALAKKVNTEARKVTFCPHCGGTNGSVKKVAGHALKIIHDKYRKYNASTAKGKVTPPSKKVFDKSFEEAMKGNWEMEKHVKRAVDDLNPLRTLNLFGKIKSEDCELLGMDPAEARPEMLIWKYLPAPPIPIRPSVQQDTASNEDDITNKLGDIIQMSSMLRAEIEKGSLLTQIMEQWEHLQIQVAMLINSDQPSLQQPGFGKTIRSFCQRLKGKGGRFRGNLSGKRVDFSGRTVISPDPNLSIEEVAVPERVAKNLTYPERCNSTNIEKLRGLILKGGLKHPGANFIEKNRDGRKINLSIAGPTGEKIRKSAAQNLEIGDVVLRHLEDGDIVLFNRQPSLHKLSIMCHRVKVRQWRTFRLNECVCSPYNADFDGDEMNLHVPQTEEARTEALELMGVKYNLATPKDGTPIIASTQDFITASYLLSSKDRFYDRAAFNQICNYMFCGEAAQDELRQEFAEAEHAKNGGNVNIELPEPTIWKPKALWTGKQVFNVLLRPNRASKILINLDAPCKKFKPQPKANDLAEDDSWLIIRNSELMCGLVDKNTAGGGKKESIFYILTRDYGPDAAVRCMNRIARLSARWLSNEGFSIGITDVWPGSRLVQRKSKLIADAYTKCDEVIQQYKAGTLEANPGSTLEETMETKLSGELSEVRNNAAKICFEEMSSWSSPVIMALSGSKGSNMNVSQMIASVGQQIIGGKRIQDGFQDRSLPHFPKGAPQPPSRGFVANSFYSGLIPSEFIFHAMSGREGLVDTAVKTAETGYMSRRLMKSLEDLGAQYDLTVRTAANNVVQFLYGEDGLDPVDMEGKGKPVDYVRVWLHAQTTTWNNSDPGMLPWCIVEHVKAVTDRERAKSQRVSIKNEPLAYHAEDPKHADDKEFHRGFLDEIEEHARELADQVARSRQFVGLDPCWTAPENVAERDEQQKLGTSSNKLQRLKLQKAYGNVSDQLGKVSKRSLDEFLSICLTKYERARVQPGHAVGAVGAQSIGEPGTQMTLKTFHFAGVAGMSLTQGVPRIKEIINASKVISTPIIKCDIHAWDDIRFARMAVAEIEKSYIHDVADHMDEVWLTDRVFLEIKINEDTVQKLGLNIKLYDIRNAIARTKGLGLSDDCIRVNDHRGRIVITMPDLSAKARSKTKEQEDDYYLRLQNLKRLLPKVVIKGYTGVSKVLIGKGSEDKWRGKRSLSKVEPRPIPTDADGNKLETYKLYVEGYGLKDCLTCPYVEYRTVEPNNIMECFSCLGIEAARQCIIKEINDTLGSSMGIDPRHMQLLADVMTFKGEVLGITRFGLAKMRDSVLQLASFEKTPDHLFDAAIGSKADKIEGVSECIIMGQSMTIGTGAMRVVKLLDLDDNDFSKVPTYFEEECSRMPGTISAAA